MRIRLLEKNILQYNKIIFVRYKHFLWLQSSTLSSHVFKVSQVWFYKDSNLFSSRTWTRHFFFKRKRQTTNCRIWQPLTGNVCSFVHLLMVCSFHVHLVKCESIAVDQRKLTYLTCDQAASVAEWLALSESLWCLE